MLDAAEKEALLRKELEALYARLLAGPAADYRETWRLFAANRRYQYELRSTARRLLRERRLPEDDLSEVVHEALAVLADRLQRHGTLGFDPRFGQAHFIGWLRHVVRSQVLDALRREARHHRKRRHLPPELLAEIPDRDDRLRREMAQALESLTGPQRQLVRTWLDERSLSAAARQLHLSWATAYRAFAKALERLRADFDVVALSSSENKNLP